MTESNPEKLLGTDNGRLILELERNTDTIETYLESANIDSAKKDACRTIITELKDKLKNTEDSAADAAYWAVSQLLNLLNPQMKNGTEEETLFKALRDTINESRDSALGW